MVKKQSFVVLVTLLSFLGSAFGLGLGDIEVKSNLNDPLEAEIKLIQLQGLTAGEVLPTLASNDDFRRAGVDRSFFLSNIQFRVKENDSGDVVVTLSTRQAVREPFLNFLVEVNWPGGRLLKEYTVLLDPPVFDTGLAVDALVVESSSDISGTNLVTTTVVEESVVTKERTLAKPIAPRDDTLLANQYRVKRNDTLWEIALNVPEGSGYSPQQVMLAIQDLNPEAFLSSNINRVKAGSVLNLPDGRQISQRTLDEAIAEVQAQNKGSAPKLRSPVSDSSEVQLSATESTSSALPTGDSDKNPDGYLELTSDSDAETNTAAGDVTESIDQLQGQLAVAEELNDQFERERDELESRVSELQEQIQIMEQLLSVQNSDLAEVQQALESNNSEIATADSKAVPDQSTEVEPAVIQDQFEDAPESTGILGTVTQFFRSALDWVMASITNMAIAGAALLLLLMLPVYFISKRSGSNQTLKELNEGLDDFEEINDFSPELDDDLLTEAEDDFEEVVDDGPEALDAVVEAEMYMAYQKYDQAEEKLKEAFSEHPDRADVAIKLLEVYAETGDASAFNTLESRLSLSMDQQSEVAELRAKLPIGSVDQSDDLDADLISGDLNLDLGVDSESDLDSMDSDLDFSLDLDSDTAEDDVVEQADTLDFSLDLDGSDSDGGVELDLDSSSDLIEIESNEPEELSTNLDFSLDLGDLDEETSTESTDDLNFSLSELDDSSMDLDLNVEEPTSSASSLDFSLEDDSDSGIELDIPDTPVLEESSLDIESVLEDSSFELDIPDEVAELDSDDGLSLDLGSDFGVLEQSASDELTDLLGDDDLVEVESDLGSNDPLQALSDSLDSDAELEDDEFDFLSGSDEASTKLDLARAYIEMDDKEGARDILEEVASEGSDDQKAQAQELMGQL